MQKSALQEFEAKLVLHEMEEPILQKSIAEARRAGYLQNRKIRVALDTTPILGKGAVKDTYNLLAEGIEMLGRRLAEVEKEEVTAWAEKQGLSRYFGGRVLPAAGSEPRRRHRSPGLGTAHPRFSGGPFDLLGPISSPERQPRLRRSVRRRVMNARRTTNHPVARTYLSTETLVFRWISSRLLKN